MISNIMKNSKDRKNLNNIFICVTIMIVIITNFSFVGIANNSYEDNENQNREILRWLSYDQALTKSKIENIPTLVYFYSDSCSWCRKLEEETFNNPEVAETMNKKFAIVKINSTSSKSIIMKDKEITEKQLSQEVYKVNANPTIWFLSSKEERIAPLPGYAPAEDFINVLNYIKGEHYKNYTFPEYIKNMAK